MKTSIKALACVATLACMATAQAQDLPSSIWFDGYCDGFSNITALGGGVVIGDYDLSNCPFYEQKLPAVGAGGTVKSVGVDYTPARFDTTFFSPLFRLYEDGNAVVYWATGVSQPLTWTAGGPTEQRPRNGRPALLAPR